MPGFNELVGAVQAHSEVFDGAGLVEDDVFQAAYLFAFLPRRLWGSVCVGVVDGEVSQLFGYRQLWVVDVSACHSFRDLAEAVEHFPWSDMLCEEFFEGGALRDYGQLLSLLVGLP